MHPSEQQNPPTGKPLSQEQVINIVEALLFAAPKPLSSQQLLRYFDAHEYANPGKSAIESAINSLQQNYSGRGINLQQVASGFRFCAHHDYEPWLARLFEERAPRYSRALLETLAIMAYRQPITRAEIEDIRGVAVSSNIIRTLQEREWIEVLGHKDSPGRPTLYGTTLQFLDYFNLQSLADLPSLAELKNLDDFEPQLDFEQNNHGDNANSGDSNA